MSELCQFLCPLVIFSFFGDEYAGAGNSEHRNRKSCGCNTGVRAFVSIFAVVLVAVLIIVRIAVAIVIRATDLNRKYA